MINDQEVLRSNNFLLENKYFSFPKEIILNDLKFYKGMNTNSE